MDGHLIRFNKQAKFSFIDIETYNLCLSLDYNRPWQIAIVNVEGEKIVNEKDLYIKWPEHEHIKCSEEAAKINHYNPEKIEKLGKSPEEILEIVDKDLKNSDFVCGHNVLGFDLYLLRSLYNAYSKDWKFIVDKTIDTLALARGLKMDIKYLPESDDFTNYQFKMINTFKKGVKTSLQVLAKEYDIPFDPAKLHDALYDLRINVDVWNKLKYQIDL